MLISFSVVSTSLSEVFNEILLTVAKELDSFVEDHVRFYS